MIYVMSEEEVKESDKKLVEWVKKELKSRKVRLGGVYLANFLYEIKSIFDNLDKLESEKVRDE